MDTERARQKSLRKGRELGLFEEVQVPLLDAPDEYRGEAALVGRTLALHAAVAVAHGFDPKRAGGWVDEHGLAGHLTPAEREVLDGSAPRTGAGGRAAVESLWALVWILSPSRELDFLAGPPDDLVKQLPNLREGEGPERFRDGVRRRDEADVLAAADFAYCLHWAVREGIPERQVDETPLRARRRALEWALWAEDWDEIELDT